MKSKCLVVHNMFYWIDSW